MNRRTAVSRVLATGLVAGLAAAGRSRAKARRRRLTFTPSGITRNAGITMDQARRQADMRVRASMMRTPNAEPIPPRSD